MSTSRSNFDAAEPATASSVSKNSRRGRAQQTRRIPPWIEERRAREQRIITQAQILGLPLPARPGTRQHARSLDPVLRKLEELRQEAIHRDTSDIPF